MDNPDRKRAIGSVTLAVRAYLGFLLAFFVYLTVVQRAANLRLADAAFHFSTMSLAFLCGYYALSGWIAHALRIPRVVWETLLNALMALFAVGLMSLHQKRVFSHSTGLEILALAILAHALIIDLRHIIHKGRSYVAPAVAYFGLMMCGTLFGVLATVMYVYVQKQID